MISKDGLKFLLEAFDIIAEQFKAQLLLTGRGNTKDENKTKCHISKLKHKEKVKLLGYLSDKEYYKVINKVDIHCMTRISSLYSNFGFPFKLGEMLATGKPVIATKVGDVEKFVGKNEALLINPDSVEEIVEAIKFLINEPLEAKKIGIAGRKCAFNNFDVQKHTQRLVAFLEMI